MARRGLQIVLTVVGTVALVFGSQTVLTGGALIPGGDEISSSVDSELRFYAAWYVAAGLLLLRAVPRVEREGTVVRLVAAFFFVAAVGRVLSMVAVGPPRPIYVGLMVLEFILPAVLAPWQALVARGARGPTGFAVGDMPAGTAAHGPDKR